MNTNDKRGSSRRDIARIVQMATGLGQGLKCSLKDISSTGARIEITDASSAPQEFLIKLNDGLLRWCRVMWRSEKEIGITFIEAPRSLGTKKEKVQHAPPAELIPQSSNSAADETPQEHSTGAAARDQKRTLE
jgi:hypothetical protein